MSDEWDGFIEDPIGDLMRDEDELPYDGDYNDPKQYCKHGTFIGSWWGPDYLCALCESE